MDSTVEKGKALSKDRFQFRMGLNDNKAGMEGLDKEKINKIIMEATKGSKFYDNELKKDQQVNQRIEKMLQQKSLLTSSQMKKAQIQMDTLALELEQSRDLSRVIVHVDMDAFYAAVEMRDNPDLRDKPMAVGSMSMLSTSNYLARRFGVRAAMPGFIAKKLCPTLHIVPLNFDKYRAVSKEVREIFSEYDTNFLPLSLDEAYLDITDHLEERLTWPEERRRFVVRKGTMENPLSGAESTKAECKPEETQCTSPVLFEDSPTFLPDQCHDLFRENTECKNEEQPQETVYVFGTSAEEAVREMRFRIEQKTTLTASAGIAPNMMLAKVCSDKNKPNGQYIIPHDRQAVMDFIKDLPIRKVPGIGKVTEKMLQALGITTCTDLYQQRALLSLLFSDTSWLNFLHISLGLGSTRIEKDGERKSMSTERTFSEMSSAEEQYELCRELCKDLAEDLSKEGLKGRTVTLKLKNVKFEVKTRASTMSYAVSTEEEIFSVAKEILKAEIDLASPEPLRLRLMGVRISGFLSEDDRKHQTSITSFLGLCKATKTKCSEMADKSGQATQTPVPQRQSFFNQKRAARQLEQEQGSTSNADTSKDQIEVTHVPCEQHKDIAEVDQFCHQPDFTCPICMIRQSDWNLEAFNKHIDQCLNKPPPSDYIETISKCENVLGENNDKAKKSKEGFSGGRQKDVHIKNLKNKIVTVASPNDLDDFVIDKNTMRTIQDQEVQMDPCKGEIICKDPMENHQIVGDKVIKIINECKTASPPCSSTCREAVFICPVCNVQQDTSDLVVFNRHVDVCLNKGILEELEEPTANLDLRHPIKIDHQNGLTVRGNGGNKSTARTKRPGMAQQNPASKKAKTNRSNLTIDTFFK
ncbi:DNA polymerase kappa isoform X2 [Hyla sarda]|nr:DNA polymerase kappa isoform X2 [Hyla sarda]XP_056396216.1 DNA polymerase kappa isoform X2 [Hyla sarda]XP_056396226.1 DNA polymerase kappa isoform X2 [Hyla sarda]XP_056396236.1 DNA polymerase kappa isoform X2 [Hyla sarda]XP_056396245.1 DNA polymerase kappa isoform X2 [Hyla sarda]